MELLQNIDHQLTLKIYFFVKNHPVILPLVTFFAIYAVAILMVLLTYEVYKRHWAVFLSTLVGILVIWSISQGLSLVINRDRPFVSFNQEVTPLIRYPSDPSFPSDHTVIAFAIATFLTLFLNKPKIAALLYICAFLVGLSRVGAGVHYIADIIVGAILGTVAALIWYNSTKNIDKRFEKKYKFD